MKCILCNDLSKGQLISKGRFGVIVWTKNPTSISALASKKTQNCSNQKQLLYDYVK